MFKKIFLPLIMLLILLIPNQVNADEINKFDTALGNNIVVDYNINGSSLIGGNDVIISSSIDGASLIGANNLTYNASSEYALILANNISFTGSAKDAFMFANTVNINANSKITRDIIIYANTVNIEGDFARNVTINANTIKINNAQFGGKVKLTAKNIEIEDNVMSSSELSYNEEANTNISQIANLGVVNTFKSELGIEPTIIEKIYSNASILISLLIVFTALFYIIPVLFNKINKDTKDIVKHMGYGLVSLIILPIIAVILCLTVFGMPLGLLILAIYIILLLISIIPTGYIVGNIIWNKFIKTKKRKYIMGIMGTTIVYILCQIPYIGGIVVFLTILLGMGSIIELFFHKKLKD